MRSNDRKKQTLPYFRGTKEQKGRTPSQTVQEKTLYFASERWRNYLMPVLKKLNLHEFKDSERWKNAKLTNKIQITIA